jgi:hypothetical protein
VDGRDWFTDEGLVVLEGSDVTRELVEVDGRDWLADEALAGVEGWCWIADEVLAEEERVEIRDESCVTLE